jgi:phenylacetate-coenzyme A ligase PaaK-like adenylate-forming protein
LEEGLRENHHHKVEFAMLSDLTARSLHSNAYSDRPFTFLDQSAQNYLANITAIDLIENGDRTARENWQNRQLTNLLRHAHAHSSFWRQRMPSRMINHGIMKYLPIQSRADIGTQVTLEGPLVANDGNAPISSYASTGSTGTPVKVYVSEENGYYNNVRSLAQYFIDNLSLEENLTRIGPATSLAALGKKSLDVTVVDSWAGALSGVFRTGKAKKIIHQYDDDALIRELLKDRIGYLNCPNRYLDVLMNNGGTDFIKRLGIKLWLHSFDYRDPEIVKALEGIGVPSLSNYSAGEIGPIAYECTKYPGYFHVAHTNVVIECDTQLTASFNGASLGRLLITHLHSYATPLIRYDIGDFAQLDKQCRCGHDGVTITDIFGRGKHFLRHPNGKLLPFYLSTRALLEAVAFKECRVRQTEIGTIIIEIGGRENITADEDEKLRKLIIKATDPAFNIKIKPVKEIDWSGNPKRLFFSSSVA